MSKVKKRKSGGINMRWVLKMKQMMMGSSHYFKVK